MKPFDELTRQELVALTDEQVARYIALAVAEEGIRPVDPPVPQMTGEIDAVPTVTAYKAHGLYFMDENDALLVAQMAVFEDNTDYAFGYNNKYKWISRAAECVVTGEKFYEKADIDKHREKLAAIASDKKRYETERDAWRKYTESTSKLHEWIYGKLRGARQRQAEIDRAAVSWKQYLDLADGNEDVARRFFEKAYGDDPELCSEVMPDNVLELPV